MSEVSDQFKQLEVIFKREVTDRANEVDESQQQDWYSITLGWAIAKGLEPLAAHKFACHIRYHTELG